MRLLASLMASVLLFGTAAFAADPVGDYEIEGSNPGGGGTYGGTVTVRKTGETYSVIWVVGGTRYVGTGIGNKGVMAGVFCSGNKTRPPLFGEGGGDLGRGGAPI